MEAAVAEREMEMTEWNDGRLDDLSRHVSRIERKVDDGFARINGKFDALHRMLFQAAWALVIGLLGLVGVLVGLIATKL